MGASIKEVAERVGVSTATVSIYLNSPQTKRVGDTTKRKIDKAVKDLNYRKNLFASSLSRHESMIIGVIIPTLEPHFRNFYTNALLSGIQERLSGSGFSMLFFPSLANSSMEIVQEQLERSVGCDGYVLFSTGFCPMDDIHKNIAELRRTGKPFVTLNVPEVAEEVDQILIEDLGTARGVSYLMKAGHRDVLLVVGRKNGEHSRLILDNYRAVLKRFKVPYDNDFIVYGNYEAGITYNSVERFMKRERPITAVCCMSDTMAMGASEALRSAGFAIPQDVSLIGRNNMFFSRYHVPPLSTIDLHIPDAGRMAAEVLLANMGERQEPQKIRIPGTIIERESVNEMR